MRRKRQDEKLRVFIELEPIRSDWEGPDGNRERFRAVATAGGRELSGPWRQREKATKKAWQDVLSACIVDAVDLETELGES